MKSLFVCLVLVVSFQAMAAEKKVIQAFNQKEMARVDQVVVTSRATPGSTGFGGTVMKVFADVTFSNSCMAAQGYLVTKVEESNEINPEYVLETLNISRMCPMNFAPVTIRVLVDTIYSDIRPIPTINGVR